MTTQSTWLRNENRNVLEVLPLDDIVNLGASHQLANYTQEFRDFEIGYMCGWISALINSVFEFYGTQNFTSEDIVRKTSAMVVNKYPRMQIGWFANWYCKWVNGEYGTSAPNMVMLIQKLNQAAFELVTASEDEYRWKDKYRMADVLDYNAQWLFRKELTPEYLQDVYRRKIKGRASLDEMYLSFFLMDGTVGEKSVPFLIDHFKDWIERRARENGNEVIWTRDEWLKSPSGKSFVSETTARIKALEELGVKDINSVLLKIGIRNG